MNTLLEQYGDALISCIFGAIILVFVMILTSNYYDGLYPQYNQTSIVDVYADSMESSEPPVIIINKELKIRRNDERYDAKKYASDRSSAEYQAVLNNYKALATAYESDSNHTQINVDVLRIEDVDITQPGTVHNLIYKATNSNGHTTTKQVYVLIN